MLEKNPDERFDIKQIDDEIKRLYPEFNPGLCVLINLETTSSLTEYALNMSANEITSLRRYCDLVLIYTKLKKEQNSITKDTMIQVVHIPFDKTQLSMKYEFKLDKDGTIIDLFNSLEHHFNSCIQVPMQRIVVNDISKIDELNLDDSSKSSRFCDLFNFLKFVHKIELFLELNPFNDSSENIFEIIQIQDILSKTEIIEIKEMTKATIKENLTTHKKKY